MCVFQDTMQLVPFGVVQCTTCPMALRSPATGKNLTFYISQATLITYPPRLVPPDLPDILNFIQYHHQLNRPSSKPEVIFDSSKLFYNLYLEISSKSLWQVKLSQTSNTELRSHLSQEASWHHHYPSQSFVGTPSPSHMYYALRMWRVSLSLRVLQR